MFSSVYGRARAHASAAACKVIIAVKPMSQPRSSLLYFSYQGFVGKWSIYSSVHHCLTGGAGRRDMERPIINTSLPPAPVRGGGTSGTRDLDRKSNPARQMFAIISDAITAANEAMNSQPSARVSRTTAGAHNTYPPQPTLAAHFPSKVVLLHACHRFQGGINPMQTLRVTMTPCLWALISHEVLWCICCIRISIQECMDCDCRSIGRSGRRGS